MLEGADLRGSILDDLRINPQDLRGAIIEPGQAAQIARLLGIVVRTAGE
jgi:hypothetical protein